MIDPIPPLPPGLKEAALRGTLIPFIGAGASRIAGCPNWNDFADRTLRYFVDQGKFTHGQLAQLSQQHPRIKLTIALGLQRRHNLPIKFDAILYPDGRNTNPKGRRLYEALSKFGKTFVTTNYDRPQTLFKRRAHATPCGAIRAAVGPFLDGPPSARRARPEPRATARRGRWRHVPAQRGRRRPASSRRPGMPRRSCGGPAPV